MEMPIRQAHLKRMMKTDMAGQWMLGTAILQLPYFKFLKWWSKISTLIWCGILSTPNKIYDLKINSR